MAGGKQSPQKAMLALRRDYALQLRIQGGSFRQIADHIARMPDFSDDYNEAQAYRDVQHALGSLAKQTQKHSERLKQLELERLEALIPVLMKAAKREDWFAVDRLLSVIQLRIKLMGLDKPPAQEQQTLNPLSGLVAVIADARLKLQQKQAQPTEEQPKNV